jgi:hypothetical protein
MGVSNVTWFQVVAVRYRFLTREEVTRIVKAGDRECKNRVGCIVRLPVLALQTRPPPYYHRLSTTIGTYLVYTVDLSGRHVF